MCGCCTVLLDGESVRSCLMLAVQARRTRVETVESLSVDPQELHPIQEAFAEEQGLQCGFCTPAMVLRTKEIISTGSSAPTTRSATRSPGSCAAAPATRTSSTPCSAPARKLRCACRAGVRLLRRRGGQHHQTPGSGEHRSGTESVPDTEGSRATSTSDADRKRVEDPRLLVGRGGYIADIKMPGLPHAAILRSPVPHAKIVSIDASEALKIPGVIAVVTGEDCKAHMNPCMNFGPATIAQYPLAVDKVRYVGEAVAAVIAENRYIAEDGVDALVVEFEELPPLVDPFEGAGGRTRRSCTRSTARNLAYERTFDFGDVDDAFAEADLVVEDRLHWGRSAGMPLETTGAVARPGLNGVLEIHCNSMNFSYFVVPHRHRAASSRRTSCHHAAGAGGRQLRQQVHRAQGAHARGLPRAAGGAAGLLRRGPPSTT